MTWTTLRLGQASFKSQLNSTPVSLSRDHNAGHYRPSEESFMQLRGHYTDHVLHPQNTTGI